MKKQVIRILSRKSDLAQIQARLVGAEIYKSYPDIKILYLTKSTEGDIDNKSPLSDIGATGVFTEDLRHSLKNNKCDLVVHSWKDLPIDVGNDTLVSGSLKRADERDILLFDKKKIEQIKTFKKISIFSSSPRRIYNLKNFISDYFPYQCDEVEFLNIRGNIPTRIKKLLSGNADALIVAKAAVDRLINNPFKEFDNVSKEVKELIDKCLWMVLPLSLNPSSPGQGALAIEIRYNDVLLDKMIKNISNPLCVTCVKAEREILKKFGGGCHQKIGISYFPTLFGIVKIEKGEIDDSKKFYNWTIQQNIRKQYSNVKKNNIFPQNLLEYKFYKRKNLKNSVNKINALKNHCIWISRKSALPNECILSSTNIVWTSGLKTWKALSDRGVWVNGTADNMGEDFNPNIYNLCQLPWIKFTHSKSPQSLIKNTISTYDLVEEDKIPDLSNKKYFFWMSSSAFKIAISRYPSILEENHACGLGNTFKEIKKVIKDPQKLSVFLSYDHWKKSILNE